MKMPTSANGIKEPIEPVTPESPEGPDGKHSTTGRCVLPPAPKGKPKAPPLIRGKIKSSEVGYLDNSVSNGSKIPLLKTKHMDFYNKTDSAKFTSESHNDFQEIATHPAKSQVHRTVEKVRVSKGIEMKRVTQESNGVHSRRNLSMHQQSDKGYGKRATDSSLTGDIRNPSVKKRMVKAEASFPQVRSYTQNLRCNVNVPATATSTTGAVAESPGKPETGNYQLNLNLDHEEKESKPSSYEPQHEPEASYKTVDEFLKMPETALKKPKLYKSKFWDYLDPTATKIESRCHTTKDQKKAYDTDDVKSYMQKQKEVRRLQQVKELKERREEHAKRQKMLKELDSKCQRIALKGQQRMETACTASQSHVHRPAKRIKIEAESPNIKYLTPLLVRRQGRLLRNSEGLQSDAAKQAQYLLTEFENIVKRECISFLKKIPTSLSAQTKADDIVHKVDKSVSTSASCLTSVGATNAIDNENKYSAESGRTSTAIDGVEIPSVAAVSAATKIQATFRGHKVRQALKDANLLCWKNRNSRIQELSGQGGIINHQNVRNASRRWSFPKMPEKPYDNVGLSSKLLPMSPIPLATSDSSLIPFYIPPPPPTSQSARSPPHPKVLPSFPLTPVRLRVYDEPYPLQARRLSDPSHGGVQNDQLGPSKSYPLISPKGDLISSATKASQPHVSPKTEFQHGLTNLKGNFDLPILTPLPSIVDVLREKVRLFASTGNFAAGEHQEVTRQLQLELNKLPHTIPTPAGIQRDSRAYFLGHGTGIRNESTSSHGEATSFSSGAANGRENLPLGTETPTPKVKKKHKRRPRSHPRHPGSPKHDTTTSTVDTDMEFASSSSSLQTHQNSNAQVEDRSRSTVASRSGGDTDITTTSKSFGDFLAPALRLRFEAEKERLKIIEKALQVKLHSPTPQVVPVSTPDVRQSTKSVGQEKKSSPESGRLQLAIANCQKESMKAAAEMAKWMAEFQKTTKEHDATQAQNTSVDLASMVYAAVEQARQIGEEKRKDKEYQKLLHAQAGGDAALESQYAVLQREDKSVETSLRLIANLDKVSSNHSSTHTLTGESSVEHSIKNNEQPNAKDYQQQFPSESERDSPSPFIVSKQSLELNQIQPKANVEVEDFEGNYLSDQNRQFEPVDYPSIVPTGNSIDITSFGPIVSSMGDCSSEDISHLDDVQPKILESAFQLPLTEPSSDQVANKKQSEVQAEAQAEEEFVTETAIESKSKISDNFEYIEVTFEDEEIPDSSVHSRHDQNESIKESLANEDFEVTEDDRVSVELNSSAEGQEASATVDVEIPSYSSPVEVDSSKSKSPSLSPPLSLVEDDDSEVLSKEGTAEKQTVKTPPPESYVEIVETTSEQASVNHLERKDLGVDPQEESILSSVSENLSDAEVASLRSVQELVETILSAKPSTTEPELREYDEDTFENEDTSARQPEVTEDSNNVLDVSEVIDDVADVEILLPDSNELSNQNGESNVAASRVLENASFAQLAMKPPPPYVAAVESKVEVSPSVDESLESTQSVSSQIQRTQNEASSVKGDKSEESVQSVIEEMSDTVSLEKSEEAIEDGKNSDKTYDESDRASEDEVNQAKGEIIPTSKDELEIPLKPPPPYSPSNSLESTSLSSKSLIISLQDDKLLRIIEGQADMIWEVWTGSGEFPEVQDILTGTYNSMATKITSDPDIGTNERNAGDEFTSAMQSFDILLNHLVYETMKEVLQVDTHYTPYIERVRPGPLSLQAQKLRIPKAKENLVTLVMSLVLKAVPSAFFSQPHNIENEKPRLRKWCSRPRELVDEVLLQELIEEDYQWTEWWPEEVIVLHQVNEKIIKSLIRDTIKKRKYVFGQ